jgi:hypothetical protein
MTPRKRTTPRSAPRARRDRKRGLRRARRWLASKDARLHEIVAPSITGSDELGAWPAEIIPRESLSPGVQRALERIFPAQSPAIPTTPTSSSGRDGDGTSFLGRVAEERAPYTPGGTLSAPEAPEDTE